MVALIVSCDEPLLLCVYGITTGSRQTWRYYLDSENTVEPRYGKIVKEFLIFVEAIHQ